MKKIISLILIMSVLLTAAACGTDLRIANYTPTATDLMKDITPTEGLQFNQDYVMPSDSQITDFAVRLFKTSNENGKNTLISPLSVLYALAMTANGAEGNTLSQMEKTLGMNVDDLNAYLYGYLKNLPQGDKYILNLANSIWFRDDERFTVNKDFLQTNADYYSADIYKAPFDDTTLNDINHWVNEETNGMIPKILDKIPDEAVMYLVNALAFEAEWMSTYEKADVREGIFILEDGTEQTVEFMHGIVGNYFESDNAKGFKKYFKERKYAFVALLPNEGVALNDYIASLDGKSLHQLISNPQTGSNVEISIPVFESECDVILNDVLKSMGMTDAFEDVSADFTSLGTSTVGNIYISRVLHKTNITVGPQGAKAGAATVVETCDETSVAPVDDRFVHLNRPFVYMLIDCDTNTPFFIGTMNNISG